MILKPTAWMALCGVLILTAAGSSAAETLAVDPEGLRLKPEASSAAAVPSVSAPEVAGQLVTKIKAVDYTGSSGGMVYKYPSDTLVMYGGRSVDYPVRIPETGKYGIRFWTAQATSKATPGPDYRFHFNIYIDGQVVSATDLLAERTYSPSGLIPLNQELTADDHTLTIQWTNDMNSEAYDTSAGIRDIELYRIS